MLGLGEPKAGALTYADLFAGCGGLSLGLEWAGFRRAAAIEVSPDAALSYYHNLICREESSGYPWSDFIKSDDLQVASGLIVGDIDRKTRDFVHVSDVIQGLLLIADRGDAGEIFNLGSGEETSMRQLTDVISSITGRKAIIDGLPDITEDTYRLVADISRIKSIGYSPKVSLVEGIRHLVEDLGEYPEMPMCPTIFKKGQRGEV